MISLIILVYLTSVMGHKGRTNYQGRIVGGVAAEIEDYPYQVSLQLYGSHICGGSIISQEWILTAGHCVESIRKPEYFSVRVGSTTHNAGGKVYTIVEMIKHPQYSAANIDYDIALLKSKEPISAKNAEIIKLPSSGKGPKSNSMATITGWGALREGGRGSRTLQMVQIPVVDEKTCRRIYEGFGDVLTKRMFCAGLKEGGKDSCQGDSGGPLVVDGLLYGAVSWGYGCASPGSPGIYTNLLALRSWITKSCGV